MKVAEYVGSLSKLLDGADDAVFLISKVLKAAKNDRRSVWILGNGGSLAVAQHFAQDLLKMAEIKAQCLNDPSVITAYSNDHAFDYCYYAPLRVLRGDHDPVIIFSCSGKSRNYIEFVSGGVHPLIAVVGTDGGFLKDSADIVLHIFSNDYQLCETAFSILCDLVLKELMENK